MVSGFLSSNDGERLGDKEFLKDYDREAKTSADYSPRRSRLRQRIREGISDFSIVFDNLPAEERKKTFEGKDVNHPNKPGREISDGDFAPGMLAGFKGDDFELIKGEAALIDSIADTIAFLWLACYDAQVEPKRVMKTGIERASEQVGRSRRSVEVSVLPEGTLDRRQELAKQGRKKMATGEDLLAAEVRALFQYKEELVPAEIVSDYLRGELDAYELPPLPFEDETDSRQATTDVEPGISDEELEEALDDEFTVRDGTIIYGEAPVELDDSMVEAVTETLLDFDMGALADGLVQENDHINAPVLAKTVREFVLNRTDIEELAGHAEVSRDVLQRVLTRHADEIEASLAAEYDNIENHADTLSGWAVDTDDE